MKKKHRKNRKEIKKRKPEKEALFESDENFGFIVGYTSNGVPYGLTHEEWNEINIDTENDKNENDNIDLPF